MVSKIMHPNGQHGYFCPLESQFSPCSDLKGFVCLLVLGEGEVVF